MLTAHTREMEAVDVPLNTDGTYVLGSIGVGDLFHPDRLVIRYTESITGVLPTCLISVGTNSPGCDNIVSAFSLGAVTAPSHRTVAVPQSGNAIPAVGATTVWLKVDYTSGTGGKANVSLIGNIDDHGGG